MSETWSSVSCAAQAICNSYIDVGGGNYQQAAFDVADLTSETSAYCSWGTTSNAVYGYHQAVLWAGGAYTPTKSTHATY